jgi:hypothetical protein
VKDIPISTSGRRRCHSSSVLPAAVLEDDVGCGSCSIDGYATQHGMLTQGPNAEESEGKPEEESAFSDRP